VLDEEELVGDLAAFAAIDEVALEGEGFGVADSAKVTDLEGEFCTPCVWDRQPFWDARSFCCNRSGTCGICPGTLAA
jgi:hypothetical protein